MDTTRYIPAMGVYTPDTASDPAVLAARVLELEVWLALLREKVEGLDPPMTMTEALDTWCGSKPLDCSAFITEEQLAAWEMCRADVLALIEGMENAK